MSKYSIFLCSLLLLSACQSVEQLTIDYMIPADVSFPNSLRRVAVVNNMPVEYNNQNLGTKKEPQGDNLPERIVHYYEGDGKRTAEALADALADAEYFDEVVICDSALREKAAETPSEAILSTEQVNELTEALDVDFLVSLENIQVNTIWKTSLRPEWGLYLGTVDVKVFPTVRVYLPNRRGAMVTLIGNDSIYWEEAGQTEAQAHARLISEKDMLQEASDFAGSVPVRQMLPYWQHAERYLFTGGSVNMRDAAVYAKEGDWEEAGKLWKQVYDTKKGKQQMYAAYNLALSYEMRDSISTAKEWVTRAEQLALPVGKTPQQELEEAMKEGRRSYYLLFTLYKEELKKREEGLSRLDMQMQRFNE